MKRSAKEVEALLQELVGHGLDGLNPGPEQLRTLLEEDCNGPLHFLNLLAYHDTARYPEGHEMARRKLRRAEAYSLYGAVAIKHVTQRGGRLVAFNDVEQSFICSGTGWHPIAIMEYPNTEAFIDMLRDPEYTAALVHRDACLAETVVLVSRPLLAALAGCAPDTRRDAGSRQP